jgi:hypothetical protein
VRFIHWLHYPLARSPQYPLDRRLNGPQSQPGQYREVKILDPVRTQIAAVTILTAIWQLVYAYRNFEFCRMIGEQLYKYF